jgi:pyruvate dehydrogenase E2 component (dihydrolipoamide acetyltransferase)
MLVKPGDVVAREQALLELETDKATIEVPSSLAGRVTALRVAEGDKVRVGDVLLTIEESADEPLPAAPRPAPDAAGVALAPAPADPVQPMPDLPRHEHEEVGAVAPGAVPQAAIERPAERAPSVTVPAAPSVRRLARELGVDIARVQGSGPGGRIAPDDVKAYAKAVVSGAGAGEVAARVPLPDFSRWGEVERQPLSTIRRKTAEHVIHAWSTIPHVTQHDTCDISALEELRKRHAPEAEAAGGRLTVTAIALKVVAVALRRFPRFNSSLDMAADALVLKRYVHIGVAVDTERGLLVPVIRDVDTKGIIELAVELAAVSEKAKARKLTLEEMEGGSFTITNLGGIGGTAFTPIVRAPEVAILGVSRARTEPVWVDGSFEPRLMMPLSLSYDHRVIDGADAARFLRWVAEAFEQPLLLSF